MTEIHDEFVQWYDSISVRNIDDRAKRRVDRVDFTAEDHVCNFKDKDGKEVSTLVTSYTRYNIRQLKKEHIVAWINKDRDGFIVFKDQYRDARFLPPQ